MVKTIYIAGGCFWGVEHYYSKLRGIIETKVGYANGSIGNPSYEQVCSGKYNFVEVVEIEYDSSEIDLQTILIHFFRFVNPFSLNKQGEDEGIQYRSGVYSINEEDLKFIQSYLEFRQSQIDLKIQIESSIINNFYKAEEYHQKYLYKNPNGYCHININDLDLNIYDNEKMIK
ncbi:peptide-methionine (S)-S-oxide reductase [Metamycoplasma cloacale]|uniref:Peptide methionine sulfoxide reductase MsrA n=1 Tax=Metamycoplasma cloacale TaxID=92401 RepID=A0A2Z4LL89_9BACT|nr:peptide-methionine (S)-S-oxide reductase MsrA [Metamycoplasma cloacale]AWX42501.1 peptide-methionine (S)-S-oxide reductase [Metamycoplasma cloacale]VEU79153.1 peptide-methionine (S)-S-oxide reductase [Metamycoplasma cloacale]